MSEVADVFRRMAETHNQQRRDRSEMYLQVGRAIVTLSEIEEYMAEIFMAMSQPIAFEQSAKMFYEIQNIGHKLKLVDYAIQKSGWEEGKKAWPGLSGRIFAQKFVRNVAAHASLEFKLEEGEQKTWRVTLGTQAMDTTHKKSEFRISDMKKTADELQDIEAAVKKFLVQAIRYIGPDPD